MRPSAAQVPLGWRSRTTVLSHQQEEPQQVGEWIGGEGVAVGVAVGEEDVLELGGAAAMKKE